MTGFSNTEEDGVQLTQYVPFLLEDKLKELGEFWPSGTECSQLGSLKVPHGRS